MNLLSRILQSKKGEIDLLRKAAFPAARPRRPSCLERASGAPLTIIGEIKRRSPSAGPLSTVLSVGDRARVYERCGARMISVLTDGPFFGGAFDHLTEARAACSLPILCKDFILDEVQLDAAHAFGADAVLLIARCVDSTRLDVLVRAAAERDLEALVEVVTDEERARALDSGAKLIGVNARDLDTLAMDGARAAQVLEGIPRDRVAIHLSGLVGPHDVSRLRATRADAALVGEALMRADDPAPLLEAMCAAAR